MKNTAIATLGLLAALTVSAVPASAQMDGGMMGGMPMYRTWQTGWDSNQYDRRHTILGTVAGFRPFRLQVTRRNGVTQSIDLKQGTRIYPVGSTPANGQRVAVLGRYSNGTFVAQRVILR